MIDNTFEYFHLAAACDGAQKSPIFALENHTIHHHRIVDTMQSLHIQATSLFQRVESERTENAKP